MSTPAGSTGQPSPAPHPLPTAALTARPAADGALDALCALAVVAGGRIIEHYRLGAAARAKADGSPVTDADEAAEAVILAGLPEILPGVPVVSEEAAAAGFVPECGTRFVLVDPLDGTREYVGRNGEFTVNIAVIEGGRPVLGVVYAPVSGKLWCGDAAAGRAEAMTVAAGEPLSTAIDRREIRARPAPADGLTAFLSRSHCDAETREFLTRFPIREKREAGSSLKFCLIAEGEADLYPRFSPTMQWDTAAGHAILAAAGGRVACPDGSPLPYGRHADGFRNGPFVAKGCD